MLRIIHLSDLHIRSKKGREENTHAGALVSEIVSRYGSGPKTKTLVVITGDLVDDAKSVQYKQLRKIVLGPLEKKFRVLAVAGNHDLARHGNLFDKHAPARFRKFVRNIAPFPKPQIDTVEITGERSVLFVGVDSADEENKVFFADGIVSADQRRAMSEKLNDAKYEKFFKVVYVHHHPFLRQWFVSFKEADEFLRTIQKKVDLLLFGHKHVHEAFVGRYDVPRLLASGKVTARVADMLAFRVIELDSTGPPRICTVEVPAE